MVEVLLLVACLAFAAWVLNVSTRPHLRILDDEEEDELEDQWNEDDL